MQMSVHIETETICNGGKMKNIFKNYLQVVSQRKRSTNIANIVANLVCITLILSVGITKGYLNNVLVLLFVIFGCAVIFIKISFALYCLIKN
ncbi:hypothetical protein PAALTS15_15656 [Paenibacillus alvei TS-15]|uniref:Uncharacterized protein n=1 Tax=Paenibacillus alvei TS-15 TaxID=1117108 RepID=S9SNA6_PAEAL|nr:hypothetical protein PAALTS15_15656 [Paenibacillus alvei TS-15]